MNRLNTFEAAIIGFFTGVVVASYWAFLESIGRSMGNILSTVSLVPVQQYVHVSHDASIYISFLFFIIVYVVYGIAISLLLRLGKKTKYILIVVLVMLVGFIIVDEKNKTHSLHPGLNEISVESISAPTIDTHVSKKPEQYFGEIEVRGDINGDQKDDIVFIASRKNTDKTLLYYMSAALAVKDGYQGTELLFLGDGVQPVKLSIDSNKIAIEYNNLLNKKATTTKMMYVTLSGNDLVKVKP